MAQHNEGYPPKVMRYSQIGKAPEPFCWWRPLGVLYATVVTSLTVLLLLLTSPLLLLLVALRRFFFSGLAYHTHPADVRIAVVGGGWCGVQCVARLKELGVKSVTGFERFDALGGTWHQQKRYHNLQIHGAMWVTAFSQYPYNSNLDLNDGKVAGHEMQNYIHRFADDAHVTDCYQLNSRVVQIQYASDKRQATLVVEDASQQKRMEGPFDFVIFASMTSEPNMPQIAGRELFGGEVIHSSQLSTGKFEEIVGGQKQVAVLGASKSACDVVQSLHRAGYGSFSWVYRKAYLFAKYEVIFHDRSLLGTLRGLSTLVAVLLMLVSETLAGWVLWGSGFAFSPGKGHDDWRKFHFGVLCPHQRRDLSAVPAEKITVGSPVALSREGLVLESGDTVAADVVVCCTGSQSGIDKIAYVKDGEPYSLDLHARWFQHFVLPDFPVLGNATALWTTFGPVRGVNTAELAVYHLCVQQRMSEQHMAAAAARQLSGAASASVGWLFQGEYSWLRAWLTMHLDLLRAGLVDPADFVWHAAEVFVFATQSSLPLRILPSHAPPAGSSVRRAGAKQE